MATIDDIVKISGVSRSTVFRFLNGNNVRSDAKNSIIKAMKKLDYKTDELYKYDNIQIDISISKNIDSFQGFTEMVQGITQRANDKNIPVNIVTRTGNSITTDYPTFSKRNHSKGVIVLGKNKDDENIEIEMLKKYKIPHIFLNRILDDPLISYVATDLKQAACDVVDYLIKLGHKKIAVCGNPQSSRVDFDKLEGYKLAFKNNHLTYPENLYIELNNNDDWEKTIVEMLKNSSLTAFLGICDSSAIKFINIAQSLGFKIPEKISVVGMDNVDIASYVQPSLTTIKVDFKKMGILAVDHLLQLISDSDITSKKTIVKHALIERESCSTKNE